MLQSDWTMLKCCNLIGLCLNAAIWLDCKILAAGTNPGIAMSPNLPLFRVEVGLRPTSISHGHHPGLMQFNWPLLRSVSYIKVRYTYRGEHKDKPTLRRWPKEGLWQVLAVLNDGISSSCSWRKYDMVIVLVSFHFQRECLESTSGSLTASVHSNSQLGGQTGGTPQRLPHRCTPFWGTGLRYLSLVARSWAV